MKREKGGESTGEGGYRQERLPTAGRGIDKTNR